VFIHIGTKQRVKPLHETYEYCQRCGGETAHAHREVRQWLTLYWIPVFPVGATKRVDYCQECVRKARQIGGAAGARAGSSKARICPECGSYIGAKAFACRHCGQRFTTAEIRQAAENMKRNVDGSDIDALRKKVQRGG